MNNLPYKYLIFFSSNPRFSYFLLKRKEDYVCFTIVVVVDVVVVAVVVNC